MLESLAWAWPAPRCELSAARSLEQVTRSAGACQRRSRPDGFAVLLCCTTLGVVIKPHGQSRGLKA